MFYSGKTPQGIFLGYELNCPLYYGLYEVLSSGSIKKWTDVVFR